ncbi:MAG: ATP-binding protein [Gammaproteobacteria bacterium]|nr:ATP-binding protein [Gammaproteobacteria bacterium]
MWFIEPCIFMPTLDIDKLLCQPEDNRHEWTTWIDDINGRDQKDKICQAICALSNDFPNYQESGYICVGVTDDGRRAGKHFTDKQVKLPSDWLAEGKLLPRPNVIVHPLFNHQDGQILVIEVKPSEYPPVRYDGRCWLRLGPSKTLATPDQEMQLAEKRRAPSFDALPVTMAQISDLNVAVFSSDYLPLAISEDTMRQNGRTVKAQLSALRFYDPIKDVPTKAGILTFGLNPLYDIPGAYIQYVRFSGVNKNTEVVSEKSFSGNFMSLLPVLASFVETNLVKARPIRGSGFQESMQYNYPPWVLRELLMNAVMHRDYASSNAPIYVYECTHSLEITNPGGLFGVAKMGNNLSVQSDYRNVVLAEVLKVLGYVNRFGYGIARVQELLQKNGQTLAQFDTSTPNRFSVTIPIHPSYL